MKEKACAAGSLHSLHSSNTTNMPLRDVLLNATLVTRVAFSRASW